MNMIMKSFMTIIVFLGLAILWYPYGKAPCMKCGRIWPVKAIITETKLYAKPNETSSIVKYYCRDCDIKFSVIS